MLAEWIKNHRGRLINAYIAQCSEAEATSEAEAAAAQAGSRIEVLTRFVVAPVITLMIRVLRGENPWTPGIQKIVRNALKFHKISVLESLRGVQTIHRIIRACIQKTADTDRPAEAQVASLVQQVTWLRQLADFEAQAVDAVIQVQEELPDPCIEESNHKAPGQAHELERYHELYTTMPEGMALHKIVYAESANLNEVAEPTPVDYIVLDANPAYEDIWGMRQVPVLIGQKASDVYNRDNIPYLEIYAEVAMSGNPTTFEITDRLLGTTFQVSVFSPAKGQFATLVKDITQRKRLEEKQQKLIAVLENSADFIGLVTFEGQSFYVNAAGRKMLGLEGNGQFVHTAFFEYFKPEDMPYIRQHVLPTVVEQGQWEGKLNFRNVDCETDIPAYCNIFVVRDTHNQTHPPLGLGIVGHNLDKHQRMEVTRRVVAIPEIGAEVPIGPLACNLETVDAKASKQTKVLTQAFLSGSQEQKAACASPIVVLDISSLETALEALVALEAQTTLSPAMTEALKKLGIDVDLPKMQSQGRCDDKRQTKQT